jgi:hypothetical protein
LLNNCFVEVIYQGGLQISISEKFTIETTIVQSHVDKDRSIFTCDSLNNSGRHYGIIGLTLKSNVFELCILVHDVIYSDWELLP